MNKTVPIVCGSVSINPSNLGVRQHNAGYAKLGLNYTYIAMSSDNINDTISIVRKMPFRGLGVSMPFKEEVIGLLDSADDAVKKIGACNTVINNDGHLKGYNTDWVGALGALDDVYDSNKIKRAVIVGSGGVARAIAYALRQRGIDVIICGRSREKRKCIVDELGLQGEGGIEEQGNFEAELIINATPDSSLDGPVNLDLHQKVNVVFDVVFRNRTTQLVRKAKERGLVTIPGWSMLLHQALGQFELYTGMKAPIEVMSMVLEEALPE